MELRSKYRSSEDGVYLRIGEHEWHGWKARAIAYAVVITLFGLVFAAGMLVGH